MDHDKKLRKLLGKVVLKARKYGTRSQQVANFVTEHKHVEEFPELAATLLVVCEGDDWPEDTAEADSFGERPIPQTWKEVLRWTFTPHRISFSLITFTALLICAILSRISPAAGILTAFIILWLAQRAREI